GTPSDSRIRVRHGNRVSPRLVRGSHPKTFLDLDPTRTRSPQPGAGPTRPRSLAIASTRTFADAAASFTFSTVRRAWRVRTAGIENTRSRRRLGSHRRAS